MVWAYDPILKETVYAISPKNLQFFINGAEIFRDTAPIYRNMPDYQLSSSAAVHHVFNGDIKGGAGKAACSWKEATQSPEWWIQSLGGASTGGLFLRGGIRTTATQQVGTAIIPKGIIPLGKWGETRLANFLNFAGTKPAGAFGTSLGKRFVDRLVNRVAHEAKAGLNVVLSSSIRKQILKDKELIAKGIIDDAHWHFFRGAAQETLDFLTKNIPYTNYLGSNYYGF